MPGPALHEFREVPWEPKKARSVTMQICASLLLRPDDTEQEVLLLASAVLFNPEAFSDEPQFEQFLKTVLMWEDAHIRSLIVQINDPGLKAEAWVSAQEIR